MRVLSFLLVILASSNIYSQSHEIGAGLQNLTSDSAYTSGTWINNINNSSTDGSVYLFENWKTYASIVTNEGKRFKIVDLNYDTKADQFVVKISTDSIYMFDKKFVEEAVINNREFKKYVDPESNTFKYYEVLSNGTDFALLRQDMKILREGDLNPLTQTKRPDKYLNKYKYFVVDNANTQIREIVLSKKNILNLFGEKSEDVKQYMSKNKLSVKSEKDLKRIFYYYRSI